jgi:hypothetical protein
MDRRTFLLSPLALWGCGGSGGDIMSNASNLGSLPTTQGTAFAFTPGGYPLNTFYQQPTELMYSDTGGQINRINDRLLVGEATKSDATQALTNKNWLETFFGTTSYGAGAYTAGAVLTALTGTHPLSSVGAVFGSQSLNFTSVGAGTIGVTSIILNNNTSYATLGYSGYFEAHRMNTTVGQTIGTEVEIRNAAAALPSPPDPWHQTVAVGFQIGCGAGLGSTYDAGAAIQIWNNPNSFNVGILFGQQSITNVTGDGTTFGTAIGMALGHLVAWYNASGNQAGTISSNCTAGNNTLNILFGPNKIQFLDNGNSEVYFQFARIASAVNGIQFVPAVAGSPPYILPNPGSGGDANIDLRLLGYGGSGYVRFGTYVGSTITNTGYITIKDDAGTLRRLMVG